MPRRNPCRLYIHLAFTYSVGPSSVVWRPAPPFPPMRVLEVQWSRALSLIREVALSIAKTRLTTTHKTIPNARFVFWFFFGETRTYAFRGQNVWTNASWRLGNMSHDNVGCEGDIIVGTYIHLGLRLVRALVYVSGALVNTIMALLCADIEWQHSLRTNVLLEPT